MYLRARSSVIVVTASIAPQPPVNQASLSPTTLRTRRATSGRISCVPRYWSMDGDRGVAWNVIDFFYFIFHGLSCLLFLSYTYTLPPPSPTTVATVYDIIIGSPPRRIFLFSRDSFFLLEFFLPSRTTIVYNLLILFYSIINVTHITFYVLLFFPFIIIK